MNSAKTDPVRDMGKELESFRIKLGQDFQRETEALEEKKLEHLERLEEITRQTLTSVDGEWEGLQKKVFNDAALQRRRAFSRLDEMLGGLNGEALVKGLAESTLSRLLAEEERKDAGP